MNVNQLPSRSETKARAIFFYFFDLSQRKFNFYKFGTPNFVVVVDWIGSVTLFVRVIF
jgi:hypothetical protein